MKYGALFTIFGLTIITLVACKKTTSVTCDGSTPTYDSFVKNIIDSKCVSCHSGYSSYDGLSGIISSGKFEKRVIIEQDMPQNGTISSGDLSKLKCWVDNGYPEN